MTGPSEESRNKALLKRRRQAGLVVDGGASKNKRRAELRRRGYSDEQVEERVKGVGHAGEPFFTGAVLTGEPLGKLPTRFTLHVSHGEDARVQLRAYHTERCYGMPHLAAGRDRAKADAGTLRSKRWPYRAAISRVVHIAALS